MKNRQRAFPVFDWRRIMKEIMAYLIEKEKKAAGGRRRSAASDGARAGASGRQALCALKGVS
jgi:hypothetical protein